MLIPARFRKRDSFEDIAEVFDISERTARRTKWRVQGYMLFKNPTASLPSHINHTGITQDQVCV